VLHLVAGEAREGRRNRGLDGAARGLVKGRASLRLALGVSGGGGSGRRLGVEPLGRLGARRSPGQGCRGELRNRRGARRCRAAEGGPGLLCARISGADCGTHLVARGCRALAVRALALGARHSICRYRGRRACCASSRLCEGGGSSRMSMVGHMKGLDGCWTRWRPRAHAEMGGRRAKKGQRAVEGSGERVRTQLRLLLLPRRLPHCKRRQPHASTKGGQ
jgi:hypothetical protein